MPGGRRSLPLRKKSRHSRAPSPTTSVMGRESSRSLIGQLCKGDGPVRRQTGQDAFRIRQRGRYRSADGGHPWRRSPALAHGPRSGPWPPEWKRLQRACPPQKASPLAAATPMRIPVKDPGPAATATASMSAMRQLRILQKCPPRWASGCGCGSDLCPDSRQASSRPSSTTAADTARAEVSSARIFMAAPLL